MTVRVFVFFVYLISVSCLGQNITISGRVKDINKEPIAYANVVLLNAEDTSFIFGTTTNDNGVFEIETPKMIPSVLKISFLGFEDITISIDVTKNSNLGVISLKENIQTLDGVTVVSKRPTVKRLVDRLVFNVENSTLSNNNVLDVLKHTPSVLVLNDKISVKNSSPTVYINDRKIHLSSSEVLQLLEGTSATNIKSIEVITTPPAKYEAEGGAILNIVTSKNIIAGYNGSVFGNYKKGKVFPKYAFGTSHFFKTKKLNTYLNYSINPRKDYMHNTEFLSFENNSSWDTNFKRKNEAINHNINTNIDYIFNDRNSLGFSTNILVSPREATKTKINSLTQVFNINKVLDSTFNTTNNQVNEIFNSAITLDYIHKFKKEGEKLSISVHHTNYDFSGFQDVNTDYFLTNTNVSFKDNRFQTFSSQKIKLNTGQLDYELPINNSSQFETGLKTSNIKSESVLTHYSFENEVKTEDIENSDTFIYDEINYAVYTSYSKEWDSWSLKTGLRVELTDIKGKSMSTIKKNTNDYVKFFPTIQVLNRLNSNNELYFNYNKRIHRPRYSQLNPFKYFLNDNSYVTGDPNLKPQTDDVLTLGYTLNNKYTFEAYYRYEKNPTLEIVFQDNADNTLKYINTNIDRSISYGLDFTTYTPIINNWNLYVYSSLFYYDNQFFALESNNVLTNINKWSVYAQIVNYFTFLKDKSLTADVSYLYISSLADGPSIISNRNGLDINLRKTLWNNKASVNIGVTDIFNSQNFTQTTKYLNQDVFFKSMIENRLFTVGFNYKFGNYRLKTNEKEIKLSERDRLGNKTSN